MENATKALLIAGAVLIALLLISLGISVVNSGSDSTEQANSAMESTSVFAFNQPYLSFISKSASGTSAKFLTNKILQHNMLVPSTSYNPGEHHIYLNFYSKDNTKTLKHKWKTNDLNEIYNNLSDGKRYKIYVTNCTTHTGGYYNGYIACISIKEL